MTLRNSCTCAHDVRLHIAGTKEHSTSSFCRLHFQTSALHSSYLFPFLAVAGFIEEVD